MLVAIGTAPAGADAVPPPGTPATVTGDALPTVQLNGVVWASVIVGNTAYVTGDFDFARPAGMPPTADHAGQTPVSNLIAFDIRTGALITSFSPTLNGQGLAIAASPDGSRLYVGGEFDQVDGAPHSRIVAFDLPAGTLDSTFNAVVGDTVDALAPTNTGVYVGGSFTMAGNANRTNLAAFDKSGVLQPWAPTADDNFVTALTLTPDHSRVIIGGHFDTLNHSAALGSASVDAVTGKLEPWALNQIIQDRSTQSALTALTTDGKLIYGSGYSFDRGKGNFEGTFAADPITGKIVWLDGCHGDTYDVWPVGQVLYSVSHAHDCSVIASFPDLNVTTLDEWHHALAETTYPTGVNAPDPRGGGTALLAGQPASSLLHWFPDLGIAPTTTAAAVPGTVAVSKSAQAAWTVSGNAAGTYIILGGEFPTAGGAGQQSLVRYAVHSIAPHTLGPIVAPINALTVIPGPRIATATAFWQATWDRDNQNLTYALYRDGALVLRRVIASNFWTLPMINFVDSTAAPGRHRYALVVSDPDGNTLSYAPVSVTVLGVAPK